MLLHGLTTPWPSGSWILIQALFWTFFCFSVWRLNLDRLRSFDDTKAWALVTLFFTVLWRLNAGIEPGLSFHLFGASLMTLLFGFPYMVLGGVLGMVGNALSGVGAIVDVPASALAVLIIPGAITHLIWRLSVQFLPPNFFIYVWVVGFFGAAIGMAVSATATTTLLWTAGLFDLHYLMHYFFPFMLMQGFPEGFVTGTILSLLVVYQPTWVATFRDSFYLQHASPGDAHHLPRRRSDD